MAENGVGSLDDVIGSQQQRRRDGEAECFGSLEVDDELKLGRLLDGEFCRLRAFEDLVNKAGRSVILVKVALSVADQPSDIGIFLHCINRRKPMLDGELSDQS